MHEGLFVLNLFDILKFSPINILANFMIKPNGYGIRYR